MNSPNKVSTRLRAWITGDSDEKTSWLFNPFIYVAGWKALLIGIFAILAAGHIGSYSNTHFDGVLDVHSGGTAPQWFFLAAGIIDWLCMGVVFWIVGKVASKKSFRAIDIFGTQALARWPTIFTALATLPPAFTRFNRELIRSLRTQGIPGGLNPADTVVFSAVVIIILLVLVWMLRLMYSSYKVACNPDRGKAGRTFVIGLVIAEILSKAVIFSIIDKL